MLDGQSKQWRESRRIQVDVNNMMSDRLGDNGIHEKEIENISGQIHRAAQAMKAERGRMVWRELPYQAQETIAEIENTARDINRKYESFVVLGIGGSALGALAIQQALVHLRYNELPREKRGGAKVYIEDNIDPERMSALFDVIDPETTMFNVITKSGSTSETMAQFLIILDQLRRRYGDALPKHMIATTDLTKGNLRVLAQRYGLKSFCVPDGVGGRFSVLSPVGLLPAAVLGVDIRALLCGAAYMDEICSNDDVWQNPAYLCATLQYIAMQRGKNISVMMPYADSLKLMADWYAQLWAESLGKRFAKDGKEVFAGQTPVKALGVTDQHSQVQLYVQGPFDKVITLIRVEQYRAAVPIPQGLTGIDAIDFLGGHTLNELILAEESALEYALMKNGRMNCTIRMPSVEAFTVGQLFYMLEVETAFAGELLRIDAFDQPGVEEGKNATYALMGKPGFDEKREELRSIPQPQARYIL